MLDNRDFAGRWVRGGMAVVCLLGCDRSLTEPAQPNGLRSDSTVVSSQPALPLQLLVVSDPELAAEIDKQWTARSGTPIAIRQTSEELLLASLPQDRSLLESVDAIIYPSALMGTLITADQLAPVPNGLCDRPSYAQEDIFPLLRGPAVRWGRQSFALPLGSPLVMLAYRSDLLPVGTALPGTWEEWSRWTRNRHVATTGSPAKGKPAEGDPPQVRGDDPPTVRPILQTLAPGHAAVVFLARAAASVRHRSQYSALFDVDSMRPRIDNPAFVRALEQLVADCALSGGAPLFTPEDAMAELVAGRTAMVIGRPPLRISVSASETEGPSAAWPATVRFAPLPGAQRMYNAADDRWDAHRDDASRQVPLLGVAGRLGSALQSSRRRRSAWNLLLLLSGPQWSVDISASSRKTAPFRRTQQEHSSVWTGPNWSPATVDSWFAALESNLGAHDWLHLPRIPGYRDYLSVLDQAVRDAAQGTRSPQESLSWAAGKWMDVTESLGRDSQKTAYRRSIGLDP